MAEFVDPEKPVSYASGVGSGDCHELDRQGREICGLIKARLDAANNQPHGPLVVTDEMVENARKVCGMHVYAVRNVKVLEAAFAAVDAAERALEPEYPADENRTLEAIIADFRSHKTLLSRPDVEKLIAAAEQAAADLFIREAQVGHLSEQLVELEQRQLAPPHRETPTVCGVELGDDWTALDHALLSGESEVVAKLSSLERSRVHSARSFCKGNSLGEDAIRDLLRVIDARFTAGGLASGQAAQPASDLLTPDERAFINSWRKDPSRRSLTVLEMLDRLAPPPPDPKPKTANDLLAEASDYHGGLDEVPGFVRELVRLAETGGSK